MGQQGEETGPEAGELLQAADGHERLDRGQRVGGADVPVELPGLTPVTVLPVKLPGHGAGAHADNGRNAAPRDRGVEGCQQPGLLVLVVSWGEWPLSYRRS